MSVQRAMAASLWLALALGAGCKLSSAKSCTKDSDCDPSTGGSCDLAHKVCVVSGGGTEDGGLFVGVVVPAPPVRAFSDGGAYLRGDTAQVLVTSSVASPVLTWAVQGVFADGGLAASQAGTSSATTVTCPTGTSAAACATIAVDLSVPPLQGMGGNFVLTVNAKDSGGRTASATGTVPVTRLVWEQNLGGALVASPAIADDGTVYFATADGGAQMVAVRPDGTTRWTFDSGKVIASPAVGVDAVYVAGEKPDGGSNVLAVSSAGVPAVECPSNASAAAQFVASLAVVTVDGKETAFSVSNDPLGADNGALYLVVPSASTGFQCSAPVYGAGTAAPGATIVSSEGTVFFGDRGGQVYAYSAASLGVPNGWGNASESVGSGFILGLGVMGSSLVGATKPHGAFGVAISDGMSTGRAPDSDVGANPGSVAIASDSSIFFGTAGGLRKAKIPGPFLATGPTTGQVTAAPVLGQGSHIYTASTTGSLQVWDPNLVPEWSASLSSATGGFFASPNLDCARYSDGGTRSGPGTLYLAAVDGTAYAIQVDSHGLDVTAPWPRYQHDGKSTGNTDTGILSCP